MIRKILLWILVLWWFVPLVWIIIFPVMCLLFGFGRSFDACKVLVLTAMADKRIWIWM